VFKTEYIVVSLWVHHRNQHHYDKDMVWCQVVWWTGTC